MRRTTCALVVTILAYSTTDAPAQPAPGAVPAEAPQVRKGLMLGFGVGGGNISAECDNDLEICDEVLESGSFNFQIGSMIAPRLAVLVDSWAMVYHEDFLTITHFIGTVGAKYWVAPKLWLHGGLGMARASFEYDGIFVDAEDRSDAVPGLMAAIGFELYHRTQFSIDVQLRGGTGFYEEDEVKGHNAALVVGFTWF